ncbi:MAG: hypothetical protein ACRYGI_10285 [Janthinobacterium lividum]
MEVFRYWIGASPEAPLQQIQDVDTLYKAFSTLDDEAVVEQFGTPGSMILLKVEIQQEVALDFTMPATVIAFEHRRETNG